MADDSEKKLRTRLLFAIVVIGIGAVLLIYDVLSEDGFLKLSGGAINSTVEQPR